jgi:hypothetical protein
LSLLIGISRETKLANKMIKSEINTGNYPVLRIPDRTILNDSNVIFWIKYYKIEYPEIVLKQIKLETGNYKSRICKENNNLFGMHRSYKRPNVMLKKGTIAAYYSTWQLSILDYKLWQDWNNCKLEKCNGNYYLFLKRVKYSTSKNYINLL